MANRPRGLPGEEAVRHRRKRRRGGHRIAGAVRAELAGSSQRGAG